MAEQNEKQEQKQQAALPPAFRSATMEAAAKKANSRLSFCASGRNVDESL